VQELGGRPLTFVFVLGTGRCGSTLVHEVLAKHPDAGFVSNLDDNLRRVNFKGRTNNLLYRRIPPRFTQKGRLRFAPSEGYLILDRFVSPAISTPCRDLMEQDATPWLAARFRSFYEERAGAQGKPVFLHKFTGWPRARFIKAIFPEARFIHVIRDGRAVANSFLQMPWWKGYRGPTEWSWGALPGPYAREWEDSGRSYVLLAGLEWKLLIDAFEASRAAIPEELWMDVRYEDFISDPRTNTEKLLRFVGLEWTDPFDAGFEQFTFSKGRSDAYVEDLGEDNVRRLNASLADHLQRHGYEV
jgi:sulfotransferase family protein